MSNQGAPRVSVIMAVHNGARHLPATLASILAQSWRDFELLIADDVSTDQTPELLASAAAADPRIRVLRLETNLGPFAAANRALERARGEIIVRTDADDLSRLDRIERQIGFLDAHPDHLFVASSYRAIDDEGRLRRTKIKPMDHFALRWLARFRMPVEHPSLCFRARLPDGTAVRYDGSYRVAQDYPFVAWLCEHAKGAVLAEPLLDYRTHAQNISSTRTAEQRRIVFETARQVQARDIPSLAPQLDELLRCYLLGERATLESMQSALRALEEMLARDTAARPDAAPWLRRQTAGILAEAFLRRGGGFRDPRVLGGFLRQGRRFLGPLVLRALEDKGRLPHYLQASPEPGR
ncbi:MAG: glycosyltransferase family 2 protein [Pseudomonadota bacterium]